MSIPNAVTITQLYQLIGTPECPAVVDVRIPEDFDEDPRIIPGAIKRDFDNIDVLAAELADQNAVIYCQKGFKISQGTAALLRQFGITANFLVGGQYAWRDANLPMVQYTSIPRNSSDGAGVWVTRHRPKIDRIACPWLIRRFIDPTAKILFVEPDQVTNVADRFKATPFDVENVKYSHRGELCSFDTMLEEFGLSSSEPLNRLAHIIRGADTNRHDLAPQSAGLLAISVGLSHMFGDDLDQLEAGMPVYDALYRWARDAKDEGNTGSAALHAASSK